MSVLAVLALMVSALSTYAVLSRKVRDGVIVKLGLICIAIGSVALVPHLLSPDEMSSQAIQRALALCAFGLFIATLGMWRRLHLGERIQHFIHQDGS